MLLHGASRRSRESAGVLFVDVLLNQDWPSLTNQLATDVRYRGVTTSRVTEATDRGATIEGLQRIFEDGDTVVSVVDLEHKALPSVERISYQFRTRVADSGTERQAEQHVYLRTNETGGITGLDLLCSGWLPLK